MMKSMKKLLLMTAIAVMMVSLVVPAAMAEEVQDPKSESSGTEPVVGDHPEGSSNNNSGIVEEEPAGGVPADDEPICMIPEGCDTDEKPYKDPGIRQCDLLPVECPDTEDSDEKPYQDPGIRKCDLVPPYCQDTEDTGDDNKNEHNNEDGYPEYCKLPKLVYDPACDKENHHSQDSEDSQDDQGHNSGAHPDADDPNPVEEEESKKEEASAPGGMKAVSVSAPADEAGQTTDSGTIHGCPFDYEYFEEIDMCLPSEGDYEIFETLFGDTPWPDSAGGYVGLLGDLVEDPVVGAGTLVQLGLGYVEDALVWYGEDFGIAGWPFLGIGYTIGFAGDVAGAVIGGVGEAAGAVADGVGEAIDAVGDAAGAVYDEISSWF